MPATTWRCEGDGPTLWAMRRTIVGLTLALATCMRSSVAPIRDPEIAIETRSIEAGAARVAGIVRAVGTGESYAGAVVVLTCACLPTPRETTTNGEGRFAITELPAGSYELSVIGGSDVQTLPIELAAGERVRVRAATRPGEVWVIGRAARPAPRPAAA